jgi:hypothetical protein
MGKNYQKKTLEQRGAGEAKPHRDVEEHEEVVRGPRTDGGQAASRGLPVRSRRMVRSPSDVALLPPLLLFCLFHPRLGGRGRTRWSWSWRLTVQIWKKVREVREIGGERWNGGEMREVPAQAR